MEHAQRDVLCVRSMLLVSCLNPYFNGTCSKRPSTKTRLHMILTRSLNPYFNGTCSKRGLIMETILWLDGVLILILMEHAQREDYKALLDAKAAVLILILMEHAQRADVDLHQCVYVDYVLILILMEHAQRGVLKRMLQTASFLSLNPYFNGTCSKRRRTRI